WFGPSGARREATNTLGCVPLRFEESRPGSVLAGSRARAREARLQAQDRLRVQLRDPRFRHAEHLADLAQGQLLVVVEGDDELLALGQAGDRLPERLPQLRLGQRRLRLGAVLVGER